METSAELTDLTDLNRILLNLARSKDFPDGSSRHGYDFIAPLDLVGRIDPVLWRKYRDYCRVRRFWAARTTRSVVSSTSLVAPNTHAGFSTTIPKDDDDEAGYKFGAHAFLPGEYVSISGQDGKLHTFRVVTVDPIELSMALIKSFELEIKL